MSDNLITLGTLHMETDHKPSNKSTSGGMYVTTDGLLRFCIVAPLLELPLDFKEWHDSCIKIDDYQQTAA